MSNDSLLPILLDLKSKENSDILFPVFLYFYSLWNTLHSIKKP